MEKLFEIVKKRSIPGTLIFDMNCKLLYSNREALDMILEFQMVSKAGKQQKIPKSISNLCNELKKCRKIRRSGRRMNCKQKVLKSKLAFPYSMRAFFMEGMEDKNPTHIMVLLEKIIEKHDIDFGKVQREFKLSGRELEVLKFICKGLSNREISGEMFITEYTVKDHMKKILRKMDVTSRNQIISSLK